ERRPGEGRQHDDSVRERVLPLLARDHPRARALDRHPEPPLLGFEQLALLADVRRAAHEHPDRTVQLRRAQDLFGHSTPAVDNVPVAATERPRRPTTDPFVAGLLEQLPPGRYQAREYPLRRPMGDERTVIHLLETKAGPHPRRIVAEQRHVVAQRPELAREVEGVKAAVRDDSDTHVRPALRRYRASSPARARRPSRSSTR